VKDLAATIAHRDLVVRDDMQDADRGMMETAMPGRNRRTFRAERVPQDPRVGIAPKPEPRSSSPRSVRSGRCETTLMSRLLIARLSHPRRSRLTDEQRAARVMKARPAIWAATLHMLAAGLASATQGVARLPLRRLGSLRSVGSSGPSAWDDAFVSALKGWTASA